MSECLVTQLKETIDNETLLKEGEFEVTLQASKVGEVLISLGNNPCNVWANQDVIVNKETKPANTYFVTHDFTSIISTNTNPIKIKVSPKYSITYIHISSKVISLKSFNYIHPAELFIEKGYVGNEIEYKDIFNTEIKTLHKLKEAGGNIKGTLADVAKSFNEFGSEIYVRSIAGDFKDLSNLINLTSIDFGSVKGTIESFAEGQVAAGRTSGSVSGWPGNFITYKGDVWDNTKRLSIKFDSSYDKGYKVFENGVEV